MCSVFEMYEAMSVGLPVFISCDRYRGYSSLATWAQHPVDSSLARCGNPADPPNNDEIVIRDTIESSPGGYQAIDRAVEISRLTELLDGWDEHHGLISIREDFCHNEGMGWVYEDLHTHDPNNWQARLESLTGEPWQPKPKEKSGRI